VQGTTSLIAGAFLYADFYGTFSSTTLNQIEAGSSVMQQLDAVLQYRRQANQDQMAKSFKRCYIFEAMIFFFPFFKYSDTHMRPRWRGMMSQPETRLEGREDSKYHSLNPINC